jgi:hypothetical protein
MQRSAITSLLSANLVLHHIASMIFLLPTIFLSISCISMIHRSIAFPLMHSALPAQRSKSKASKPIPLDFNNLKSLVDRCQVISNRESEYLLSFWSPKLHCFQLDPSSSSNTISVTTTCLSLQTILSNPSHWENICRWEEASESNRVISLKRVVASLMSTPWRENDAFQLSALIDILGQLKALDKDDKVMATINALIGQRPKLSLHRKQMNSAYLRHLNAKALSTVLKATTSSANPLIDDEMKSRINHSLGRANDVAFDELCRQIAFHNAGDSGNFDIIVLTYSLVSYWQISQRFFLESKSDGVFPQTNMNLVELALDILFSEQAMDGTWRKGEPISSFGESKKNIGNSYVFFFDVVESLLTSIGEKAPQLLIPYVENFERCIEWAESNIQQGLVSDPDSNDTKLVKGWRSNHLGSGPAVGWCTAQVFAGITSIRKLLKSLIKANILEEFNGKRAVEGSNPKVWKTLMDSDLELAGEATTLKKELFNRILLPQVQKQQAINAAFQRDLPLDHDNLPVDVDVDANYSPSYSAILFGPPGTAKTTICTSLAAYLGWDFVTIDTAKFLSSGLEYVASRMTYIFDRLKALEKTIILFDEIEEFCLDRENPNLSMESRLLTTAMLTQVRCLDLTLTIDDALICLIVCVCL